MIFEDGVQRLDSLDSLSHSFLLKEICSMQVVRNPRIREKRQNPGVAWLRLSPDPVLRDVGMFLSCRWPSAQNREVVEWIQAGILSADPILDLGQGRTPVYLEETFFPKSFHPWSREKLGRHRA